MDEESLSDYYRRFESVDYVAWCFNLEEPVVYRDSDMISARARERSMIYREWMEPLGLYYSMGSGVVGDGVMFGSITLFRGKGDGDFTDGEMEFLRLINDHLCAHFSFGWPQGLAGDSKREALDDLLDSRGITGREREVMMLASQGKMNREIASELFISESTVKKHLNALYRKMGCGGRVQLMRDVFHMESESTV